MASSKLKLLPLFPLKLVVYPTEILKLHIFEPRYKQLIAECAAKQSTFGIPVYLDNKVGEYGTEVKLSSIDHRYKDGELDITVEGLKVFKINRLDYRPSDRLYPKGEVELLENIPDSSAILNEKIVEQLSKLYEILGVDKKKFFLNSFDLAHHIGLTKEQEYNLLKMQKEIDRQTFILLHLKQIVPVVIETERLKFKIKMNGHFKRLNPLNF